MDTQHLETLADGVAGGMDENSLTLPLATAIVDERLICDEVEITYALRELALKENLLVEGAAALALAGYLQDSERYAGQVNVVLLCGGNFDLAKIMPLVMSSPRN